MADPNPADPNTSVTVRNNRTEDVVVYAEQGDFDSRLGKVAANQVATLRIPDWLTERDGVQLLVHPALGFDLASPEKRIRKGEHLGIIVPAF